MYQVVLVICPCGDSCAHGCAWFSLLRWCRVGVQGFAVKRTWYLQFDTVAELEAWRVMLKVCSVLIGGT